MFALRVLGGLALIALLAACGGGGGAGTSASSGVLLVSVDYAGDAYLLQSSAIRPQLSGFDGHSPQCSLGSGRLPAGMSLNSDCSISGIPSEAGSFGFVVHIGASGVSNQLDWSVGFAVFGPSVLYQVPSGFSVGDAVDLSPLNVFWTPRAGDVVTYRVVNGSLPAGLTIDSRSGRISGRIMAVGTSNYQVRADVVSAGQIGFTLQPDVTQVTVSLPLSRGYPMNIGQWVGSPIDISPSLPSLAGATFDVDIAPLGSPRATLPQGLTVDAASGRITGTPLEESRATWTWQITEQYGGATQVDRGSFQFSISFPIYVRYVDCRTNQPCLSPPLIGLNDPAFVATTYRYSLKPDVPFPPGISLDSTTGVVAGTPLQQSNNLHTILIDVTHGGVTFTVPVTFVVGS